MGNKAHCVWQGLCLSNIRCKGHGFWIVCLHPYDPAYILEGPMIKWWFHLAVPLGGFLLVVQVVTFKRHCLGSCYPDN